MRGSLNLKRLRTPGVVRALVKIKSFSRAELNIDLLKHFTWHQEKMQSWHVVLFLPARKNKRQNLCTFCYNGFLQSWGKKNHFLLNFTFILMWASGTKRTLVLISLFYRSRNSAVCLLMTAGPVGLISLAGRLSEEWGGGGTASTYTHQIRFPLRLHTLSQHTHTNTDTLMCRWTST